MTDSSRMPNEEPWHVDPAALERYARGEAPPGQAASIEPHLVGCPTCQSALADTLRRTSPVQQRLARVLGEVIESVDGPVPRGLERLLVRIGVPDHLGRLVAATPQMQRSWLYAVVATLAFTVVATRSGDLPLGFFLVVAPLLPLAMVAASFGLATRHLAELTMTMPVRASRLLLVRAVSVLVPTFALCGAAAIALPGQGWEQVAWILPALALASATAALSTWVRPATAAVVLMSAWLTALAASTGPVARVLRDVDPGVVVERGGLFAPSGQLVALAVTCGSLLVMFIRRETLDTRSLA